MLKEEPRRLSAGLDVCERKRKLNIKWLQVFGLSNWKNTIYYKNVEKPDEQFFWKAGDRNQVFKL